MAFVPPKVGIVVLNWNGWRETIACVESVRRLDYTNTALYVVDNASEDGSEQRLRAWDGSLAVIQSGSNLGWAGGCNVGIRAALADGCSHVFLLNNDATVLPDTLTPLVEAAELPDAAALGSMIVWASDPDHVEFAGTVIDTRTGHPRQIHCRRADVDGAVRPMVAVKGCAMLLTGTALARIGLLPDEYFLNYDETDWCYRALAQGMQVYFVPASVIHHIGAVAFQGTSNPLYRYFITRNRLLFARRNLDRRGRFWAWRSSIWEAKQAVLGADPGCSSWRHRLLLLGAVGLALRDYCFGWLGNCPEIVRRMSQSYLARSES